MERTFSLREVADILALDYQAVWRRVLRGEFRGAEKVKGVYRVPESAVREYFNRYRQPSSTEESSSQRSSAAGLAMTEEVVRQTDEDAYEAAGTPLDIAVSGFGEMRDLQPGTFQCGRCRRLLPLEEQGSECEHTGCGDMLCRRCALYSRAHYCLEHASEGLAGILAGLDSSAVITSADARRREAACISEWDARVHEISLVINPRDGTRYSIPSVEHWGQLHEEGDDLIRVTESLEVGFLDERLIRSLPLNLRSVYTLPFGANTPAEEGITLALTTLFHLEAHLYDGFDDRPVSREEIATLLDKEWVQSLKGRMTVLGIASATGFAADLLDNPSIAPHLARFRMPPAVYMVDLLAGTTRYDTENPLHRRFSSLFMFRKAGVG